MQRHAERVNETLEIRRLTGSFGAEVHGVDLSREIPGEIADEIRRAFAEHLVLVFRNEKGTNPEEQHRLAELFGEPQPLQVFQFLGAMEASLTLNTGLQIESSRSDDSPKESPPAKRDERREPQLGDEFDGWHVDNAFAPFLPKAAVLRAEIISPVGGDTCFANLVGAYEALSPMMQRWLSEASAVYTVPHGFKETIQIHRYGPDAEARFDAEYPARAWPLVVTHPETGRKALFIAPIYVDHIAGLRPAESQAMIRFLCRYVTSARFVYRHHWHPGDLVVWDEVMALHRIADDYAPHERKVVRVTAGRQVPTAAS